MAETFPSLPPPKGCSSGGRAVPRYVPLPRAPAEPGGRGSTLPRLPAGAHACRRRRRAARPPAGRRRRSLRDGEGQERSRRRRRRCCPPPPRSNIPRRLRRAPSPNNAAFQALSIAPRSSMQSSPASFYSPYSLASLFSFPFLFSFFFFIIAVIIPILLFLSGRRSAEARRAPRPPETHTHTHTRTCSTHTAREPAARLGAPPPLRFI